MGALKRQTNRLESELERAKRTKTTYIDVGDKFLGKAETDSSFFFGGLPQPIHNANAETYLDRMKASDFWANMQKEDDVQVCKLY